MKTIISTKSLKAFIMMLLLFIVAEKQVNAQALDCFSGTVGYVTFTDSTGSGGGTVLDSLEIRPVSLITGVVGGLMGGRRYWIRKTVGFNTYYGSSALAVDFISNRFYIMTNMGNAIPKDIVTIDPLTGTQVVIGTTPASLNNYHFVKLATNNNTGWIYAIGVANDTSLAAATFNPLIRFPNCGTVGCATANIQILGYLPSTGIMYKWKLFNGDIVFNSGGDLFFAPSAYEKLGPNFVYTDARLFKINQADLPIAPGAGVIPMSLVADYNLLDSTVVNGLALNSSGAMFFTTRKYNGAQNAPGTTYRSQLYSSVAPGLATLMPAFNRVTPGTNVTDLATCYFPSLILAKNDIRLIGQYVSGNSSLKWEVSANNEIQYFEIQRSQDGTNFETITRVDVINASQQEQKYSYSDVVAEKSKTHFYRVRQSMNTGMRFYSNIIKLNGNKITLIERIKPNPFVSQLEIPVQLKAAGNIGIRITNQNGAILYHHIFKGNTGANNLKINDIGNLKPGIYFIELSVDNEIIREKLIKQ